MILDDDVFLVGLEKVGGGHKLLCFILLHRGSTVMDLYNTDYFQMIRLLFLLRCVFEHCVGFLLLKEIALLFLSQKGTKRPKYAVLLPSKA